MNLFKNFWILMFSSFMSFWCLNTFYSFNAFSITFFPHKMENLDTMDFVFNVDWQVLSFLFMVTLVTSLVILYSEIYMEHYNNKKFFFLMMMFFFSMLMLCFSGSLIPLMMGWDGLGITSICLIMFYPSFNTMYNSMMTMFFNRVGDVVLILIIAFYFSMPLNFFFLSEFDNCLILLMFMFCSLTKSAQFPMSCWLPAAMSAPTPISAMVHSSTLVTAGIFLNQKLIYYYEYSYFSDLLFFISSCTFILGGLMANLETDLKKIVAFSTMSQISMIMIFISISMIKLSCSHMIFHALFKTLLFCCCGLIFMEKFSDQMYNKFNNVKNNPLSILMFISIFSMTGLMFCSSFYSKDLLIEWNLVNDHFMYFTILMTGSVMTILYSSRLVTPLIKLYCNDSILYFKYFSFYFLYIFCIITLIIGKSFKLMTDIELFALLNTTMVVIMLFALITPMFFSVSITSINLYNLSFSVSYMKSVSFSMTNMLMNMKLMKFSTLNDHMFFKPVNMIMNSNNLKMIKLSQSLYVFLFTIMLLKMI